MMVPKSYIILRRAVEEGVQSGWNRAHKHTDTPERDDVQAHILDAILLEVCEVFSFEDPNAEA